MGVVRAIARKELMALLRDGRLPLLSGCLMVAFIAFSVLALEQWQRQQQERTQVGATAREQWDNQGIRNPHRGAHFGLYVFRATTPLAVIDPGIVPYTGHAIWLEPHRRNIARFAAATDASPADRFVSLTPSFLLYGITPLLLLALAFSQIAGERERGTLHMLHGVGVDGRQLLAGKLTACLSAMVLMVVPLNGVLAAALWLMVPGQTSLTAAALLVACHLLYFSIVIAIGLALASLVRDSRSGLLLMLSVWTLFVLIAPRLGGAIAQIAVPLPAPQQFWQAIQRNYDNGLPGELDLATRVRQFESDLLRQHGATSLEQVPVGVNAARRLMRDAYADRVYDLHFTSLWQRYESQADWSRVTALFSPTQAVRSLSMLCAGTSLMHQRHFEEAAEHYRRYFNQAIDRWDMQHTHGSVAADLRYSDAGLWQSIEPFRYEEPGWRILWRRALPDLAILLSWCGASLLALCFATRRLAP